MAINQQRRQARDYARIERAIGYLEGNFRDQPDLDDMARAAGLSSYHFHRLFTRWAGVSPKLFVRTLTIAHAKRALAESASVLDAAFDAGLSGPGRLHDLFVTLEAVTPGEFRQFGRGLVIRYGFHHGVFGEFLAAATERGVCGLSFVIEDGRSGALGRLKARWPEARLTLDREFTAALSANVLTEAPGDPAQPLRLWCRGTNFQVRVWQALLAIPAGHLASYRRIAHQIGSPNAMRAVGSAVAANPIARLIPCHRVIRASGVMGDYRWGSARKQAMLGWEAARAGGAEVPSPGGLRPPPSPQGEGRFP